jgi:hypothetical protein
MTDFETQRYLINIVNVYWFIRGDSMAPHTLLDTTDFFTLFYNMTPCIFIVFTQLFAIDF